ncbi:cupin domain-containing protein, partial [Bacillus paranthracis]
MHYNPYIYPYQYLYYVNVPIPMYNYGRQSVYCTFPNEIEHANRFDSFHPSNGDRRISLTDYGPKPFVVNINEATKQNNTYRTAL